MSTLRPEANKNPLKSRRRQLTWSSPEGSRRTQLMADVLGVVTANLHGTARGDEAVTNIVAATASRIDAKSSSSSEIDAGGDDGRRRTTTRAAISGGSPTLQWA